MRRRFARSFKVHGRRHPVKRSFKFSAASCLRHSGEASPLSRLRKGLAPPALGQYPLFVLITLNGERHELAGPVTITDLLAQLQIDPRRVAVELNLVILKRGSFETTLVREGDEVEIVNFVGGG
jgi:thiamine biosynthesis protein ThiS